MLLGIGRKSPPTDLAGAIVECHQRIRSFCELACVVAHTREAEPSEVAEAASRIRRYFELALPLHVEDEERSLLPRLRGRAPEVDAALARMEAEHGAHETLRVELLEVCRRLEIDPTQLEALRDRLRSIAEPFQAALLEHLALEESTIMPAVGRLLSADEQAQIRREMRGRREP